MSKVSESVKGKIFGYLKQRLDLRKSTHNWWRCDCPYCSGSYTFAVNIGYNRGKCFRCDKKVTCFELIMELAGLKDYQGVWQFLNIQRDFIYPKEVIHHEKEITLKDLELPESFRLMNMGSGIFYKAINHYLIKVRGFRLGDLVNKGVGYCTRGLYSGYAIFPIYYKGRLVYYQGRRYIGSGPKMRNPEVTMGLISKSHVVYNIDALFIYNKVYIVESITNCLTLGEDAISTLGKKVSSWAITQIIKAPCKTIVIGLDPDALKEAVALAFALISFKRVKILMLPEGKDVNDIGKKRTKEIEKLSPYLKYADLLRIKNNIV